MLRTIARRPTYLMARGIDTNLFSPNRRTRADRELVIGFVGPLSAEKNVRLLVELERELLSRGIRDYRFLVVGNERSWLAENLQRCSMPGILLGQDLAIAYANMEIFVFPSDTDTFGNVVPESMASQWGGVGAFAHCIMELYHDPELRLTMSQSARAGASRYSWDAVFDRVYDHYSEFLAKLRPAYVEAVRRAPALLSS